MSRSICARAILVAFLVANVSPVPCAPTRSAGVLQIRIEAPPAALIFYARPETPLVHPAHAGLMSLKRSPAAGCWTFWSTAPGCFPVYVHLSDHDLASLHGKAVNLVPIPFQSADAERLLESSRLFASLPQGGPLPRRDGVALITPDARGAVVSCCGPDKSVVARDGSGGGDTPGPGEVWWLPQRPGAARLLDSFPPGGDREWYFSDISISPDGEWLAYSRLAGNSPFLHVLNLQTGHSRKLSPGQAQSECYPSWSPDGASLAYLENESPSNLCLTRSDGTGSRQLASGVAPVPPKFGPDGCLLAYAETSRISVYDLRTGGHRVLVEGVQTVRDDPGCLLWSPDGQWLVFSGSPASGREQDQSSRDPFIYIVHQSGSPCRRLTRTSSPVFWLPNGQLLVEWVAVPDARGAIQYTAAILNVDGDVVRYCTPPPRPPHPDVPNFGVPLPPLPTLSQSIRTPGRKSP